jgi:hypothetical protein
VKEVALTLVTLTYAIAKVRVTGVFCEPIINFSGLKARGFLKEKFNEAHENPGNP